MHISPWSIICLPLLVLVLSARLHAFDIPRHVGTPDKLDQARKAAFEDKQLLVFVHTKSTLKENDTPGKLSLAVCEEGKSLGQVILVEAVKETVKATPKLVQDAIKGTFPKASPIVILTDPATTKVYGSFGQDDLKSLEFREIFRAARKAHREDLAGGKVVDPASATPEPPPGEKPPSAPSQDTQASSLEVWTNREGREVRAFLRGEEEGRFVFELEDKRRILVDPANLSDESRLKARSTMAKP